MASEYLKWFLLQRWLVKHAVRDWMTADAGKFEERKQYYFMCLSDDFCGVGRSKAIRRDLQSMLQLRGKVDG